MGSAYVEAIYHIPRKEPSQMRKPRRWKMNNLPTQSEERQRHRSALKEGIAGTKPE